MLSVLMSTIFTTVIPQAPGLHIAPPPSRQAHSLAAPVMSNDRAASVRLVAEATVRWDADGDPHVDLPVTMHGHQVVLLVGFGFPNDVALNAPRVAELGITLTDTTQLDSLTVGTTVEHHLGIALNAPDFPSFSAQDGIPVVGFVGDQFLARYDVVYDGPASRVRLYTRFAKTRTSSKRSAPGNRAVASLPFKTWLPSGIPTASCTPITVTPGVGDSFVLQVEGHPVTAALVGGSNWTKLNATGARVVGVTPHSSNVHPARPGLSDDYGHSVTHIVTGLTMTLKTQHFVADTVGIWPKLDDGTLGTPEPPLLFLNENGLRGAVVVLSHSTAQMCLGTP